MFAKISGVYEIVNTVNGNRYIGSAVDIQSRWYTHKRLLRKSSHHSSYLQHAWDKYGESAFLFSILRVVNKKEDLIQNEQEFIDNLRPEYNVCRKAGSILGVVRNKATREKMSRSLSGKNKGRKASDETREKISLANRGENNRFFGKAHSDETREKMRRNHKGMTGHSHTRETKHKISESHKGIIPSNEVRKKLSDVHKGKCIGSENPIAKTVYQYSKAGELINRFGSVMDAERATGICFSGIARCSRGEGKTAGGYIWKYEASHV